LFVFLLLPCAQAGFTQTAVVNIKHTAQGAVRRFMRVCQGSATGLGNIG